MMPTTTQECLENRIDIRKRCDLAATESDLYGDEKGACGEHHDSLAKVASVDMQLNIKENGNKKAQMSPAYELYKDFSISEFQIREILSKWILRKKDKYNFDLRFTACEWIADNLEHVVQSFVPPSHPRIFVASKSVALTVV